MILYWMKKCGCQEKEYEASMSKGNNELYSYVQE